MDSDALVAEIARLAADKKARDVVALDLREVLGYSDAEVGTLKEAGAFSKEPPKVKEYHALREAG